MKYRKWYYTFKDSEPFFVRYKERPWGGFSSGPFTSKFKALNHRNMIFSQNNEELVIKKFFESPAGNLKPGTLLSIGENDGETLSNSRALILGGWTAVLIEPDPVAFSKLQALYKDNTRVDVFDFGIGDVRGRIPFYSSDTHLDKGDTGLLSTFSEVETKRFPGTVFHKIEADMLTWAEFYSMEVGPRTYDAVLIDAEGFDLKILRQLDFSILKTKLVCVEWNSKERHLYDRIMTPIGFRLLHVNAENLIYGR